MSRLNAPDFQKTAPKNEKLAATTWAKDSLQSFNEAQIIQVLEQVRNIPAKEWHSKYVKGTTDTYISALQAALKILHKRNPSVYKNPGLIDGVYANVRNGKPDLQHSKTAAAMEAVTGNRGIDNQSVALVIEALKQNDAAEAVRARIESAGDTDSALRALRGQIPTGYTKRSDPNSPTESWGKTENIVILPNGKFKATPGLNIEFSTREDAIHTQVFIGRLIVQFKKKGATDKPFHIQWGSGDIEFDTKFRSGVSDAKHLGGILDTEINDDSTTKLPKELLDNKQILVDYLNSLPDWKA